MKKFKIFPILLSLILITFSLNFVHAGQISKLEKDKNSIQKTIETFITESWNITTDEVQRQKQTQDICKDIKLKNNIEKRLMGFKNLEKTDNIKYTKNDVKFNFYDIIVNENTAKVKVDYIITINYKISEKEQTPTKVYNLHDIELKKLDGIWVIISNKDLSMPDNAPELPSVTSQDIKLENDTAFTTLLPTYNRTAAVNYACTYVFNPNSTYRNMGTSGSGGDCTNFASQIIKSGGWPHDTDGSGGLDRWFYMS
ncbi:hypothetical protein Q428_12570 [Fervidicella metallireducens AeB]|uniref:Putative amidase domain-containing protein n=1 Tax=Fervidicella metallireducens AeB TaxID=1403537 RepID=A0A017RT18_9CLOT|nr:amidase domain-containing protein [Fervidicella metallireducens]EYE87569.1 hypothetical protein Q428_12570 [Fervidicella metallireducens AeB]